jgi:hypothetical protein
MNVQVDESRCNGGIPGIDPTARGDAVDALCGKNLADPAVLDPEDLILSALEGCIQRGASDPQVSIIAGNHGSLPLTALLFDCR